MSAEATVRVTFSMTYPTGPWDEGCTVGQIRKSTENEARAAAEQVIVAAFEGARVRLRTESISNLNVALPPEKL